MMKHITHMILCLLLFAWACNGRKTAGHADDEIAVYTCPMHPEIVRNEPGSCPICGMDLVKKESGSLSVEDIELETLLRPVNAFVISSVPLVVPERREEDIEMEMTGLVAYDPRQSFSISSRVSGRVERLYIRYKYQPVKKGQRVMDIYSPELLTAQENYLFILRHDPDNISLLGAARDRLLLLGMTPAQISGISRTRQPLYSVAVYSDHSGFVTDLSGAAALTSQDPMQSSGGMQVQELQLREGMYVQAGQSVFTVYNPRGAWILLDVFPWQQGLLQKGNPVRVVPEAAPQRNFRSTIAYIEPVFRKGKKNLTARIHFNNSALGIPVGSRVTATVFGNSRTAEWLPKEAVLLLGTERVVFRKEEGGFRAQRVTTGIELPQHIQITGGVAAGDSIARNAQFLVDNEAFIKAEGK